ncbi:protein of unknown function DUF629 [Dillenia turbinata]|uniref:C2H2-type domain-containing protein n=1 Tax=Dillenia turbinata TaxID=194707 RepID=A0AAN8Z847_9MAGN
MDFLHSVYRILLKRAFNGEEAKANEGRVKNPIHMSFAVCLLGELQCELSSLRLDLEEAVHRPESGSLAENPVVEDLQLTDPSSENQEDDDDDEDATVKEQYAALSSGVISFLDKKSKIRTYWDSMSSHQKWELLKVKIADLVTHCRSFEDFWITMMLSEAAAFGKEKKTWNHYQCCRCKSKILDAELYQQHLMNMHMRKLRDEHQLVVPLKANSKWTDLLEKGCLWEPMNASAFADHVKKDLPLTVEHVDYFTVDDSECKMLLDSIHHMFTHLLQHRCLAESHVEWVMNTTLRRLQAVIPESQLTIHSFDQSPAAICFLEAPELRNMLAFLQELETACGLFKKSENRTYGVLGHRQVKEKIAFSADLSCLVFDERLLLGNLSSRNYDDAEAHDGSAPTITNDSGHDNVVLEDSGFLDLLCRQFLPLPLLLLKQSLEDKQVKSQMIFKVIEETFVQVQDLCEKMHKHFFKSQAVEDRGRMQYPYQDETSEWEIIFQLHKNNAMILRGLSLMQELMQMLVSIAACDYRLFMQPIIYNFIQAQLEKMVDKAEAEGSELTELECDDKKGTDNVDQLHSEQGAGEALLFRQTRSKIQSLGYIHRPGIAKPEDWISPWPSSLVPEESSTGLLCTKKSFSSPKLRRKRDNQEMGPKKEKSSPTTSQPSPTPPPPPHSSSSEIEERESKDVPVAFSLCQLAITRYINGQHKQALGFLNHLSERYPNMGFLRCVHGILSKLAQGHVKDPPHWSYAVCLLGQLQYELSNLRLELEDAVHRPESGSLAENAEVEDLQSTDPTSENQEDDDDDENAIVEEQNTSVSSRFKSFLDKRNKIRAYCCSIRSNKMWELLRVKIADLVTHCRSLEDFSITLMLSDAIAFGKEKKTWKYYLCCRCKRKILDAEVYVQHFIHVHLRKMMSKHQKVVPLEVDPDWADMVEEGCMWKPMSVSAFLNHLKKDLPLTIDHICDFIVYDSERKMLLDLIHHKFRYFLRRRSLAEIHSDWVMEYTLEKLQSVIPESQLKSNGLHRSPAAICFLEAEDLKIIVAYLRELDSACQVYSKSESRMATYGLGQDQVKEKIGFSGDLSCLFLDERLLQGKLALQNYNDAEAHDGSAPTITDDRQHNDALEVSSFLDLLCLQHLPLNLIVLKQSIEDRERKAQEILESIEETFDQVQNLCEKMHRHSLNDQAVEDSCSMQDPSQVDNSILQMVFQVNLLVPLHKNNMMIRRGLALIQELVHFLVLIAECDYRSIVQPLLYNFIQVQLENMVDKVEAGEVELEELEYDDKKGRVQEGQIHVLEMRTKRLPLTHMVDFHVLPSSSFEGLMLLQKCRPTYSIEGKWTSCMKPQEFGKRNWNPSSLSGTELLVPGIKLSLPWILGMTDADIFLLERRKKDNQVMGPKAQPSPPPPPCSSSSEQETIRKEREIDDVSEAFSQCRRSIMMFINGDHTQALKLLKRLCQRYANMGFLHCVKRILSQLADGHDENINIPHFSKAFCLLGGLPYEMSNLGLDSEDEVDRPERGSSAENPEEEELQFTDPSSENQEDDDDEDAAIEEQYSAVSSRVMSFLDKKNRLREYWFPLSSHQMWEFLRVKIADLVTHCRSFEDIWITTMLSEAIAFGKERKTWKYYQCCRCKRKFLDAELYEKHLINAHLRQFMSKHEVLMPPQVNSDWAANLEDGCLWQPMNATAFADHLEKDLPLTVEDVDRFILDDPERESLLDSIHQMFRRLLKRRCLAEGHARWIMETTVRHLKSVIPESHLKFHELDQSPSAFGFLEAKELRILLSFLENLDSACEIYEKSQGRTTFEVLSHRQVKEKIGFSRNLSYLVFDERLLLGSLTFWNYPNAEAHDGSAPIITDDCPGIVLRGFSIFLDLLCKQHLPLHLLLLKQSIEDKESKAKVIFKVIEEIYNQVKNLCETMSKHFLNDQVVVVSTTMQEPTPALADTAEGLMMLQLHKDSAMILRGLAIIQDLVKSLVSIAERDYRLIMRPLIYNFIQVRLENMVDRTEAGGTKSAELEHDNKKETDNMGNQKKQTKHKTKKNK